MAHIQKVTGRSRSEVERSGNICPIRGVTIRWVGSVAGTVHG